VGRTTLFDASSFPTQFSAEVRDWDITDEGEDAAVWKNRGRHTKFAAGAAKQAVKDSGVLDKPLDPVRFGVYLGSGEGQQNFQQFSRMVIEALDGEAIDPAKFISAGLRTLNPMGEAEQE